MYWIARVLAWFGYDEMLYQLACLEEAEQHYKEEDMELRDADMRYRRAHISNDLEEIDRVRDGMPRWKVILMMLAIAACFLVVCYVQTPPY